jgi:hypothetical protein
MPCVVSVVNNCNSTNDMFSSCCYKSRNAHKTAEIMCASSAQLGVLGLSSRSLLPTLH